MKDLILRFVIGGAVVSAFAALGDVLKPKSLAGLFGAAPSIALATLGLTISANGKMCGFAKSIGHSFKMNDGAYFRELFNIFRKLRLVEGVVSTSKLIFMSSSASR
jgi:hypothetical protein